MVTMFSKRHYEAIAEVLTKNRPAMLALDIMNWQAIRDALSDLFESDNPRFDRAKFEEACER